MVSQSSRWHGVLAFAVILFGLVCCGMSLADWPAHIGQSIAEGLCYAQSDYCDNWTENCTNQGASGFPASRFQCTEGGTVWSSLKVFDWQQYGVCQGEGACTVYEKYYCVRVRVYQFANCQGAEKCTYYVWNGGLCQP